MSNLLIFVCCHKLTQPYFTRKTEIMSKQPIKIGNFQLGDVSDRYDPAVITALEQYVQGQIQQKNAYDKEANLFLLKLYQFNTQKTNVEFIKKVLILSLIHGSPTNDFTLATYLIQEKNVCRALNANSPL
jgi:hypothetical protein